MRYSVTEARNVIAQFKKYSIRELDILFHRESLPEFDELEGDTAGAILALNPENQWWLNAIFYLVYFSPLGGSWKGKRFVTPFSEEKRGYGTNIFKCNVFNCLFTFDTSIEKDYRDNKLCLTLDYRERSLSLLGLVDNVRKIKDGLVLGKAYYQFPWLKQMWFVGYFVLCSLRKQQE